ncbi:MAG: hypothetical protein IPF56_01230 [Chloroflexi bacterium]|nr:hypothetical protein [Chloroflexota bacterium]
MALLHIQAFGKLQMQYQDKTTTTFPTRHVEALFGYLLLYPETEHHREKLIELLWPDGSPDNARARLSTAVWRLRSVFDSLGLDTAVYLPASRDWIAFTPTRPYSCDLAQFEQALTQASQTRNETLREQCLQTAVALYRGDLFDGLYPDWILIAREQFARRFLQALGELMAACLARHAYAEALAHGQTILAADPLREEVYRALMLCYWRLGQPGQAIQQFHQCARLLLEELHILPLPETRALYQELLDQRLQHPHTTTDPAINAAYHDFLRAGETLNSLLDSR